MREEPARRSADAAQHFADAVVAAVFAPWADDLVERAAVQPGEWVLDVGCGTGAVARVAATRVGPSGNVAGIDTDANRLAVAESLLPPAGAPITWHDGDAADMPFADAFFDAVLCQQALHLMADRAGALREMERVLVPGGRLALSVWTTIEESPGYQAIADVVRERLGPEAAAGYGRQFSLADPNELRQLIADAGFTGVQIVRESKIADFADPDDFIRYQLEGSMERWNLDEDGRHALWDAVRVALEPMVQDGRLRFPRGAHIVVARRG